MYKGKSLRGGGRLVSAATGGVILGTCVSLSCFLESELSLGQGLESVQNPCRLLGHQKDAKEGLS